MMMTRIGMINDDESLQQENARSFWLGRNAWGKWGKDFLRLITLNIFEIGWIIDMVKTATDSYADFAGLPVVK